MIKAKCISKQRDSNGRIIEYELVDMKGQRVYLDSNEVKNMVRNKDLYISNLSLTSDNRLVNKAVDNSFISQNGNGNSIVTILHGSKNIIERPYFGGGKKYNDYGSGFYCTREKDIELAREWACSVYNKTNRGFVNKYSIDISGLNVLNLDKKEIINWVAITSVCRKMSIDKKILDELKEKYYIDVDKYDIVYGWRCDDAYSKIISMFVSGAMTDTALIQATRLGHIQTQFVIKSERAYNRLNYIGYEEVKPYKNIVTNLIREKTLQIVEY
jgi:hypothetical protein